MAISAVSKDFIVKHGLVVTTTATILSDLASTSTSTGALIVAGGVGIAGTLNVRDAVIAQNGKLTFQGNNTHGVSFKSTSTLTTSTTYTLPPEDGNPGDVLTTDGNKRLIWNAVGGAGYIPFPTGDYAEGEAYPIDGQLVDAFGVDLQQNYDCMYPDGEIVEINLGVLT